ncbi:hypothetical protein BCR33DRAFT_526438 [Rhizoclosmatium globosum]|uniref:Uncharacterized protein n=1 Tax=Rhizoclosmatium globosum TaxID=329046 RepID=A0A1Y2CTH5_9FUNG|nr:hypothetical protein BCR33DRAFT_526438 [Rhizoclosmatium globosum]|eukprot:ORY50323.1 hypothetical protein BCR33DRAFT_526438 [Rhizoclosmatium globosum]
MRIDLDFKEFSLMDVFSADSVTEEQNTSLYAITPLTWVRVGKYDCVLPITKKETIIVGKNETSQFFAQIRTNHTREGKTKNSHWSSTKELLTHDTLTSTIQACDSWVSTNYAILARNVLRRTSKWRQKSASPAQISFLTSRGMLSGQKVVTCGMASDLITRFKFGGVGKTKSAVVEKRKEEKRVGKRVKGSVL